MPDTFKALVQIINEGVVVPPTSGIWNRGSILIDSEGSIWICKESGEPGIWAKQTDNNNVVEQ